MEKNEFMAKWCFQPDEIFDLMEVDLNSVIEDACKRQREICAEMAKETIGGYYINLDTRKSLYEAVKEAKE